MTNMPLTTTNKIARCLTLFLMSNVTAALATTTTADHRSVPSSHYLCRSHTSADSKIELPSPKPVLDALSIDDVLRAKSIERTSPITVSPDGRWVAYVVQDPAAITTEPNQLYQWYRKNGTFSEAVGCDVWATNVATRETLKLGTPSTSSWAPSWSPDGKTLAFYSDRDGLARLWLWNAETKNFKRLSAEVIRPFFNFQNAQWTPDSTKIIAKVLPADMDIDAAAKASTESAPSPAMQNTEKPPAATSTAATVTYYEHPAKSGDAGAAKNSSLSNNSDAAVKDLWMNRYRSDIAVFDVSTGSCQRIANQILPFALRVSPDGSTLAYSNLIGKRANSQNLIFELNAVDLSTHSPRTLEPRFDQDYGCAFSWSPDSICIAYLDNVGEKCQVKVASAAAKSPSKNWPSNDLKAHEKWTNASYRSLLWDPSGKCVYVQEPTSQEIANANGIWRVSPEETHLVGGIPDKEIKEIVAVNSLNQVWQPTHPDSMLVFTMDIKTKAGGLYELDSKTSKYQKLFEENSHLPTICFDADVATNSKLLAYVRESVQEPADIWVSDSEFKNQKKLSAINPSLAKEKQGTSRIISYRNADGVELQGALLLPSHYEENRRYPMIVYVYGGALLSKQLNRFGLSASGAGIENMQLLASRGYAILLPDVPIKKGNPMTEIPRSVMPAVDRAIELGIADPDRIGVMGHSYGGYSTLALIVQSTRFRAAVSSAGAADLISLFGFMSDNGTSPGVDWLEGGQGGMEGSPWQFRNQYIENSPLFYLDRVRTPLLLIQGDQDPLSHHQQSDEVFVGLRRLGQEVAYARYQGEGHWPGIWGYANQRDYWNRVITWFDQHLFPNRYQLHL